jgi:glycine/D-amino acid oxidase-like deaminating enzyme
MATTPGTNYDVVIVGSGFGGSSSASRLGVRNGLGLPPLSRVFTVRHSPCPDWARPARRNWVLSPLCCGHPVVANAG